MIAYSRTCLLFIPYSMTCLLLVEQVVEDVLALNGIARHLKAARASNGALRLDNTKLYFKMDDNGNPVSAAPYGECPDTTTLGHP